jgi:peptidoglycan/LPS O-acetylase OafA/YrhL
MVHQFVQFRLLEGLRMVQGEIALPFHMTESGRLVLLGNPLACDLATLAMLGLVLCTAWLTFNYVEEPARQWSRKVIAKAYGARGAELKAAGELVP